MLGKRIKLAVEHEWDFLGSKQSYRKLGQGLPVVLLHGSMVADPWDGFEKRLAEHFEVYVPDLPGFGASDAIEGRVHDTQLFSEALAEFLKHSKLEQAPIIAFSLGAVVAVKTASGGGTLGKLILVGLPIRLESKLLDQICRMPLIARRVLATDELTRGGVLLAILKDVIGITEAKFLPKYLNLLRTTDVRAMVDTDLISEVEKLTDDNYKPDDMTPLYDTMSYALDSLIGDGSTVSKKMCVILTDGLENASHEATREIVFSKVKGLEADGWTFVYLGANQDAWSVAAAIGIGAGNTMRFDQTKTKIAFTSLASVTRCFAGSAKGQSASVFSDAKQSKKDYQ